MIGAGLFLHPQIYFLANSHQNSHSPKIKMATNLAASHAIDSKVFLAPQVGLEPTTLRLTAECSAIELLRSVCCFKMSFIKVADPSGRVKRLAQDGPSLDRP